MRTLQWPLLIGIMRCLEFPETWLHWILECMPTVPYSTLINGSHFSFFKPSKCVSQVDNLSPFLFTLATKAISHLFIYLKITHSLQGIKISRYSPTITHLLFVDDPSLSLQSDICQSPKSVPSLVHLPNLVRKTHLQSQILQFSLERTCLISWGTSFGHSLDFVEALQIANTWALLSTLKELKLPPLNWS